MAERILSIFCRTITGSQGYKFYSDTRRTSSKKTFKEEYIEFLGDYQIEFNQQYIFDNIGFAPT